MVNQNTVDRGGFHWTHEWSGMQEVQLEDPHPLYAPSLRKVFTLMQDMDVRGYYAGQLFVSLELLILSPVPVIHPYNTYRKITIDTLVPIECTVYKSDVEILLEVPTASREANSSHS